MMHWIIFLGCVLLSVVLVGAVLDYRDDEEMGVKK